MLYCPSCGSPMRWVADAAHWLCDRDFVWVAENPPDKLARASSPPPVPQRQSRALLLAAIAAVAVAAVGITARIATAEGEVSVVDQPRLEPPSPRTPNTRPTVAPIKKPTPPSRSWRARFDEAMASPPAGAVRQRDWPCRQAVDRYADGSVDWETRFSYGGPVQCVTPPEMHLFGCPTVRRSKDRVERFAYDDRGRVVAAAISTRGRTTRIRFEYNDGDRIARAEADTNGDDRPDLFEDYEHRGDQILSRRSGLDRKPAAARVRATIKNGRLLRTPRNRFVYNRDRVVSQVTAIGDTVLAKSRFHYDCE